MRGEIVWSCVLGIHERLNSGIYLGRASIYEGVEMESLVSGQKKIKAIDLFAGIGGIRLGFTQAFGKENIEFVYSCEINDSACKTYQANFGDDPKGDITKILPEQIPDFDILLAGFPCQPFSIAGKRKGFDDTRGTLFFYIAELLRVKRPKVFLLENVKNLVGHDNGKTFRVIRDTLKYHLNYHIYWKVLNAKDYGVPQNRERIFIVGFAEPLRFEFPPKSEETPTIRDILEPVVDDSYHLSQEYLIGLKKHRARHEAKGNGFGYEVIPMDSVSNAIVCGGMGKERNLVKVDPVPNCWKKEGDSIRLRNNEGIRKMTEREWARLQGFPDSFIFPVSKTDAYRQLGNSVAVPVIRAIATQIKKAIEQPEFLPVPKLSKKEQIYLEAIELMREKKFIPASGKKDICSVEKFIEMNALDIPEILDFCRFLIRTQLAQELDKKYIYFSKEIHNFGSRIEMDNYISKMMIGHASKMLDFYINR